MADVSGALRSTVPISLFNRGLAGKVFEEVRQQGAKVVMKNNAPECVLLSPEEYLRLIDEVNDAKLAALPRSGCSILTPTRRFPQRKFTRSTVSPTPTSPILTRWNSNELEHRISPGGAERF